MALDAYTKATKRAANPRDIEYRIFGRITGEMMRATEGGNNVALAKAVGQNSEFWTALATDCMSDANSLPDQIRAGIISLSIWVTKYSAEVVSGRDDAQALIDVNRSIMEGLAMTAGKDSQAEVQASMTGQAMPQAPAQPVPPQQSRPVSQPAQRPPAAPPPRTAPQVSPAAQTQQSPSRPQTTPENQGVPSQPQQPAAAPPGRTMAPPPRPGVPPAYGPSGGYGGQVRRPITPPQAPQDGGQPAPPVAPPRGRTDIKS